MAKNDEDLMAKADEAAISKIKKQVTKEAPEPADEEDLVIEVADGSRDEPEDDDEGEARPSRQERRQNRFKEAMERADQAERRARDLEDQLRRYSSQQQQPPPQAPQPSRDDELERIYSEQDALYREYQLASQRGLTQEEQLGFQKRARELEQKKLRATSASIFREQANAMRDEMQREAIRQRHADVYENPSAVSWARGYYWQELAKGRPDTRELFEESMEQARTYFKIGGRGKPTQQTQSRYTGSTGGTAGVSPTSAPAPKAIKMTKEYKRLADEAFPHIKDPMKRYQKWVNDVGRHLDK